MTPAPRTIHVDPGSELDRLLEEAGDAVVEMEARGVRYRVMRVHDETTAEPSEQRQPGGAGDSILTIIGLGASAEPTSIGRHEQEYLADAIDSAPRS
ncbi:MAG TPA: hypothetical protein VFN57_14110 [Thermomicrobiaceae bacterium]|nr:hypothetical protein [Thermomicrobiaceae bacterium]